jgi:predicted nuclease of restriction endonuclease-like (RecB) superfamily
LVSEIVKSSDYADWLAQLKRDIAESRGRAALAVNRELILLYWRIGRSILDKQARLGWGARVVERAAGDLRREFPDMKGFSRTNLLYMKSFAASYPEEQFVQQVAGQIPWFHNCVIIDKIKEPNEREWYIRQTIASGWSRNVLVMQIESGLYGRKGRSHTNFSRTLPAPQSELANEILKDPYNFDFLTLSEDARERDLHKGLLAHLREFLIELGVGFAFVGDQFHLEISNRNFYIDMLFYHLRLRCYVVIELKTREFLPEDAGKMNFYLSAVDDRLRHPADEASIGLILCKTKDRLIVEYALRDTAKPIGVSAFELTASLPERLKDSLPSVEDLEHELRDEAAESDSVGRPAGEG